MPGIPHPTTFVIALDGTVAWKDFSTDYKARPPNEAILKALHEILAAERTEESGKGDHR